MDDNDFTINGLIVLLSSTRKDFVLKYALIDETSYNGVNISVNRKATSIILNGELIENISSVISHKAFELINASVFPADANQNTKITCELIGGSDVATFNGNRITYKKANEQVTLKFYLGDEKTLIKELPCSTTVVSETIDYSDDVIIVPTNILFCFYQNYEFENLAIANGVIEKVGENYKVTTSGKFTFTGKSNGTEFTKTLIATKRFEEFTGVKITDTLNGTSVNLPIEKNGKHDTASDEITVSFDGVGNATSINGEKPSVTYISSDTTVATIDNNGSLTFKKSGTVTVTIKVAGTVYHTINSDGEDYDVWYLFTVYSSCSNADKFELTVNEDDKHVILDEKQTFNIYERLTPSYPLYGTITPKYYYSAENCEVDENCLITFTDTGIAKVSVKCLKGDGNYTETQQIVFTVDKYVDKITVLDKNNNERCQIVVKSDSYSLITALSSIAPYSVRTLVPSPTLTDLEYSVISGNCSISENGEISFTGYGKFEVLIKAKYGTAENTFTILRVEDDVTVIDANDESFVTEAGKKYVIDAGYGSTLPEIVFNSDATVVDTVTLTFTFATGTATQISVNNVSKNVYATEKVTSIEFKKGASDIFSAQTEFNLKELFGAYFMPYTARQSVAPYSPYELTYSSSDESVATIENGVLKFKKAGEITLSFTAGEITKTYKVESTLGYVKEFDLLIENNKLFEFNQNSFTLTLGIDYTISPADAVAEKYDIRLFSLNATVCTVDGLTINFVSGGEAELQLVYKTIIGDTVYDEDIHVKIRIVKRAEELTNNYDGRTTLNVLTKDDFTLNIGVLGSNLSPYELVYKSSDESVAKVDSNGKITFSSSNKPCYITVKLNNLYTNEEDFSLTITVRKTTNDIYKAENSTATNITLSYDEQDKISLYPVDLKADFAYSISSGDDIVSLNEYGDVTVLKGGYAEILVTGENFSATVKVFVHKKAEDIKLNENLSFTEEFVTAQTTLNLFDAKPLSSVFPVEARNEKTISYTYDSAIATIDENGVITFKKNEPLTLTVSILYNGETEITRTVYVRSTLGKATDVKLTQNGNDIKDAYTLENVGKSITFTVSQFLPSDLVLTAENFTVSGFNNSVITAIVDIENRTVTVNGIGKGECTLTISVAGVTFTTDITVLLKAQSVNIKYNGDIISKLNTMSNVVTLTAEVLPLNASDTSYTWYSQSEYVVIENGTVTITDGKLGDYVIWATANDGSGKQASVTIKYRDLTGFTLSTALNETPLTTGSTLYVKYNINTITLYVNSTPENLNGLNISDFTASSANGSTFSFNQTLLSITVTLGDTPHFEDAIKVYYKDKFEFDLNVYRSGISKIEFGNDLDNKLDKNYGLQQMRLFGYKSYYDGVKEYYKMPIKIYMGGNVETYDNTYLSDLVWTCEKGITITLDNSDNSFVYVNFNGFTGSSLAEILADNFKNGEANVYATDKGNTLSASEDYDYTFHVVNAVNVFDQAGYENGGSNIVLQVNLGHDDEATNIEEQKTLPEYQRTYARFELEESDTYKNLANNKKDSSVSSYRKTTIYGNGYLINFAHKNGTKAETKWGYSLVGITNVINAKLKGTNDSSDSDRDDFFIELTDTANILYSECFNMLRVIENYNRYTLVKRCLFRTCAESGAISSYQGDCVDSNRLTFEDVIMFDTGSRAVETHSNPIAINGFFDVYNFQNKTSLNKAIAGVSVGDGVFGKFEDANASLITTQNGQKWINVVVISAKGQDKKLYYDGKEVTADSPSSTGLVKVSGKYGFLDLSVKFCGWSYPYDTASIKWEDQYDNNGNLDNAKMINTIWKIKRLQENSATNT